MFKVIFLQRYYGLGDKQILYQIIDRTSFRQFLGIHTVDEIPDEKIVWNVRNILSKASTFDVLFDRFRSYLDGKGLSFNEGKIIDASFVDAPRQRNTREEDTTIKDGRDGKLWNPEPSESERERKRKLNKKHHKDIDAHWAKKRDEIQYGYKEHIKADKRTKLIEKYITTNAGVHNSNIIEPLIEEKDRNQPLYLDAGYESKDDEVRKCGMIPVIYEKGRRNHPLTDEQRQDNRQKSKVRCRVEHIFGFMEGAMNASFVHSIGITRTKTATTLTCLVYNIFRYV